MKNMQFGPYLWPNRQNSGDVGLLTGSRNMAVSRMRNEQKYAIWPLFMTESPKFLNLIANLGQATRW